MSTALIVQLSDLHLTEHDASFVQRAIAIAGAVQEQLTLADRVIVAITGDVANAGKAEQYVVAKELIERLKSELLSRGGKMPDVLVIPGNHDADFESSKGKARGRILKQLGGDVSAIDAEDLSDCTAIFDAFEQFRQQVETVTGDSISPIWRTYKIDVAGETALFHSVNNAWNCEIRTSPGSLGFPMHLHRSIPEEEAAVRVLLMHHPAHWISSRQYRDFRRLSRECAELCLTGHEHQANAGSNLDSETGLRLYVEGGVLNDHGQSATSSFTLSMVDLKRRVVETTEYVWDLSAYTKKADGFSQTLPERFQSVPLKPEWLDFIHDLGSNVSHHSKERLELADLYVYPELELSDDEEESNPTISASEVGAELGNVDSCLLIKGEQTSGKTALLKRFFVDALEKGLFPIYLHGARMKSSSERDLHKLIERAIEEQYGHSVLTTVKQAHPNKRLLLLDNIDRYEFPDRYMPSVVDFLQRGFGRIIATADAAFDLKEVVLSDELSPLRNFEQMRLLEFGFRLRYELVTKWCNLAVKPDGRPELDVEQTDKIVSKIVGRGLVPSFPIYVLVLLQVIEVGREGELENSALGHYYEYMILSALESKIRQEHVHELLNYCSHLAWFLHHQAVERLTEKELRRFHQSFEERFDLVIPFEERRKLLVSANICHELGNGTGFRYPYIYFFFLGRYLSTRLADSEVQQFVQRCCDNLHVRENGNAMLFLAHHSSDSFVFNKLREAVESKFQGVPTLQFQNDTEKLDQLVDAAPVLVFDESRRLETRHAAQGEDRRIEKHLDTVANGELSQEEEEEKRQALQLIADLNGLIKGIEILGTALKANFGTIDTIQKQELIATLFNGGLRGLRVFVELFSSIPDYVLAELATVLEDTSGSTSEERDRVIKVRVFNVISRFSFWFVRRIGASVGSKSMSPAVARYVTANNTIANQLVAMAGALETPGRIPFKELQAINDRVEKSPFAQSVLRLIAFTRMHMYKTQEAEKQQVCVELGIEMSTQRAIEYRTRETKKISRKG